ncbi:MAG TPA: UDP-N-acetylmuramoyl-L-alanyl-D-glutamate--2,6-diaminopimelate ligase [Deltaproteobacteria bacterium]|nr:MAG: UDP-N-acetylmuramoyl-L-alanyl-D-glutamate--2,6-diaminopimelate ligase [Deltaproteobacteria bacterium GWA2_55_82]OGQ62655.1 MAG: UDP-N-acetylmuramoyl-L-alanyl-D-glutamate--2,6-diaminopimelate ligase [Deltaproteobacteria bacterium RIFCSPLOWO2_02_FULL_55_12]OIJ74247.1 MAG: UDP-N-acetylmuramoyl-L-alanyl-D-glutamate--2,6-diaminopimelate ligase [Deltaproteobacteria bacterium GWC2_55_46]HBG46876.1 UDP-N-acetylmuramoyl-L-alanyl-D-glutamate--2,6-diaminopimelate ligase [Deltaproteobacteria bacteri
MKLSKITPFLGCEVLGSVDIEITGITSDSRNIEKDPRPGFGPLFAAIPGEHVDGHSFIPAASSAGAAAVLAERETASVSATQVIVPEIKEALSMASDVFYGEPSKGLFVIGVTGTNGKTTTTYLVESVLRQAGFNPGVIGTVNYRYSGKTFPAPHTTPQSPELQSMLKEMLDAGVTHCVMEVSSHALEQKRAAHCRFKTGVFTNLTHDHLDYHKTMDEYFRCKSILFDMLRASGGASIINVDDPWGRKLASVTPGAITFSLREGASICPKKYSLLEGRTEAEVSTPAGDIEISSHLVGEYNLYNILGAIGVAISARIKPDAIASGINSLERVPGRLEKIESAGSGFRAYVDYAHTGDALERALLALRPVTSGRLITVFGCGGNRDRLKRPRMGEIASRLSDLTIVTSDNPRDEEPLEIIKEIEAGIQGISKLPSNERPVKRCYMVIPDRREAIMKAVGAAGKGDTILVAGKGHEDYQIIKGVKHHFDDFEVLCDSIRGAAAAGA